MWPRNADGSDAELELNESMEAAVKEQELQSTSCHHPSQLSLR